MKALTFKFAFTALIILFVFSFLNNPVIAGQEADTIFTGEKITIRVDGLSCPFCAYGLEKKLKSIEGVDKLEIKVNDGLAILYLKEGAEIPESVLRKKVKEAGFTPREIKAGESEATLDAPAKKVTLKIEGMTCQGCVERVEKALGGIACARDVKVSLDKNEATLLCAGDETHKKQLVEAVEKAGFSAKIANEE